MYGPVPGIGVKPTSWNGVPGGTGAVAIEVKAAARIGDRDLAGLKALKAKSPGVRAGIVAYNGSEVLRLGDDLFAIPLGLLLS